MKYTSFYIKNYKGIKELTLELDKDPKSNVITLVGLNESGKTTVLEAIDLLNKGVKVEGRHKLIPKAKKFNFTDEIEIKSEIKLSEEDEKLIAEKCSEFGYREIQPIVSFSRSLIYKFEHSKFIEGSDSYVNTIVLKGKKDKQKKFRSLEHEEWLGVTSFIKQNLLPSIIYYPNFLFDFPSKIYLEPHPQEKEEQSIYRSVITLICIDFYTLQNNRLIISVL